MPSPPPKPLVSSAARGVEPREEELVVAAGVGVSRRRRIVPSGSSRGGECLRRPAARSVAIARAAEACRRARPPLSAGGRWRAGADVHRPASARRARARSRWPRAPRRAGACRGAMSSRVKPGPGLPNAGSGAPASVSCTTTGSSFPVASAPSRRRRGGRRTRREPPRGARRRLGRADARRRDAVAVEARVEVAQPGLGGWAGTSVRAAAQASASTRRRSRVRARTPVVAVIRVISGLRAP